MIQLGSTIFATGLRLVLPLLALLLMVEISLALLARLNSQLHLMMLALPDQDAARRWRLLAWLLLIFPKVFDQSAGPAMQLVRCHPRDVSQRMADSSKTEQPTGKRLERARREGQFASSRELVAAGQFLVFLAILGAWFPDWLDGMKEMLGQALTGAFRGDLTVTTLPGIVWVLLQRAFLPLSVLAGLTVATTLAVHLAITKMGFSLKKLTPDFTRLNPASKIKKWRGKAPRSLAGGAHAGRVRRHHLSDRQAERRDFPGAAVREPGYRPAESRGRDQGPAVEGRRGLSGLWRDRSVPPANGATRRTCA